MLEGVPTGGASGSLSKAIIDCYHADCDVSDKVKKDEIENTVRFGSMLLYGLADAPTLNATHMNDDVLKEKLLKSNLKETLQIEGEWRRGVVSRSFAFSSAPLAWCPSFFWPLSRGSAIAEGRSKKFYQIIPKNSLSFRPMTKLHHSSLLFFIAFDESHDYRLPRIAELSTAWLAVPDQFLCEMGWPLVELEMMPCKNTCHTHLQTEIFSSSMDHLNQKSFSKTLHY